MMKKIEELEDYIENNRRAKKKFMENKNSEQKTKSEFSLILIKQSLGT